MFGNIYDPYVVGNRDQSGVSTISADSIEKLFIAMGFKRKSPADSIHINRLGFINREDSNSEIAGIGDSFVEGIGASEDSTWLKALEKFSGKNTLNAGQSGNDPWFELKMAEKLFKKGFRPSYLLLGINSSDINDIIIRGGATRFIGKDKVRFNSPPWYYSIYKKSYLTRAVCNLLRIDYAFTTPFNRKQKIAFALKEIELATLRIDELCKQYNCKLIVIVHPLEYELTNNYWDMDGLIRNLRARQIKTIDMFEEFYVDGRINSETAPAYFLQGDGHHNGRGYSVFGEIVAQHLQP